MGWFHASYTAERHFLCLMKDIEKERNHNYEFVLSNPLRKHGFFTSTWGCFSNTQTPAGAHTVAVHHNTNHLLQMWKLRTVPASFSTRRLHRNDEKNPKIRCASWRKLKEAALRKRNKVLHAWLSWRRGESVVFQAVQSCWKKIRCQRSLSPHPEAGFISWAQQERRLGFVPQKQVSLTGFTACCYMPSPICATVCESLLSHTVCQFPCTILHCCFLALIVLNSDSREWLSYKPQYFLSPDWILAPKVWSDSCLLILLSDV